MKSSAATDGNSNTEADGKENRSVSQEGTDDSKQVGEDLFFYYTISNLWKLYPTSNGIPNVTVK